MSSNPNRLQTPRLELIPATVEMLAADLLGREELAKALVADVPDAWPPVNWEREPIDFLMDWMRRRPDSPGWFAWYCTLLPSPDTERILVGRGAGSEDLSAVKKRKKWENRNTLIGGLGFLGPPNAAGETIVGYSLLSDFHRQGFCPEALRALLDWAFSHEELKTLVIRTAPYHRPSIRVAEKLGFEFAGPGPDQDTVEYVQCRTGWLRTIRSV